MAGLTFTEDMTAASGVTNVGITEASFDVENLTTELEIEEVYAVSGEEVTAGDKILKLTEDSVEEARKELERALKDAEDEIAEYESYVNDGSYKSYFKVDEYQAIYDENLKALTDKLDEWGIGWSQITGGSAGSVQALKLFRELNDMGNTIVMITHDLA